MLFDGTLQHLPSERKATWTASGGGIRLTTALSSSYAWTLRPPNRPLGSAAGVSEGVVTLELAEEFLVEGAIVPESRGVKPQPRAKLDLILLIKVAVFKAPRRR